MIVTSRLSIDIVRYLDRRNQGVPLRWTLLGEIADHVYGPEDLAFNQAVDLARLRGWIIVEGKSPWRRAGQTKAGCSLVRQAAGDATVLGLADGAVLLGPAEDTLDHGAA